MADKKSKIIGSSVSAGRIAGSVARHGVVGAATRQIKRRSYIYAQQQAEQRFGASISGKAEGEKKLSGFVFWFIFALAIIKELLDGFFNVPPLLFFLSWLTCIMISLIIWLYLKHEGVSLEGNKLIVWILTLLVEFIPFLNVFPTFPLTLLVLKFIENNETVKAVAGKAQEVFDKDNMEKQIAEQEAMIEAQKNEGEESEEEGSAEGKERGENEENETEQGQESEEGEEEGGGNEKSNAAEEGTEDEEENEGVIGSREKDEAKTIGEEIRKRRRLRRIRGSAERYEKAA